MRVTHLITKSQVVSVRYSVSIYKAFLLGLVLLLMSPLGHAQLIQTIEKIKPSIVGIGTFQKTRSPSVKYVGTGFVIDDGQHVVTNAHVVPDTLSHENMESYVVVTGEGRNPEIRSAVIVAQDEEHDVAILKFMGSALPAMQLGNAGEVREGRRMAYTGFPIGMVLGFYPVTHEAIISAITPIMLPAFNSQQLDAKMIRQLQKIPFMVFQLDGIAYPGSSGSPLYDAETGVVYGVINMVFVKGKKESAITDPSGISYAIPGNYISDLLQQLKK